MSFCIICNKNPERKWPKKWQFWREKGKFSESLCKLLCLPNDPFKDRFQDSFYCGSCQERVYHVHLIVRKWDKVEKEMRKYKSDLKHDIDRSLKITKASIWNTEDSLAITKKDKFSKDKEFEVQKPIAEFRQEILQRLLENNCGECNRCWVPKNKTFQKTRKNETCCSDPQSCSIFWPPSEPSDDYECSMKCCAECAICTEPGNGTSPSVKSGPEFQETSAESEIPTPEDETTRAENVTEAEKSGTCERDSDDAYSMDNEESGSETELLKYMKRFRCYRGNCTKTFSTKADLDIHVKRHHEGVKCPYVCQDCGKAFQWKRELDSHILKHSGGVALCCHLCGKGFRTKQLFDLHTKSKHSSNERKFKCDFCARAFISESKLKTHLTIHTKLYPFNCNVCGKGFSAKTFLTFHLAKHMKENPFLCQTCGKHFSSPSNLRVHQYTHDQAHPFRCTICNAGSATEALLKKHMLKHNEERTFACSSCNKKFRFSSSLKKHIKVHQGDKRYVCDICRKQFLDKYKLSRHCRTHSKEKPFECHICHRCFASKDYLNVHVRKHDTENLKSSNIVCESLSSSETTEELTTLKTLETLPFETSAMNYRANFMSNPSWESPLWAQTFSGSVSEANKNTNAPLEVNREEYTSTGFESLEGAATTNHPQSWSGGSKSLPNFGSYYEPSHEHSGGRETFNLEYEEYSLNNFYNY